eukprot:1668099-Pyramimonas_sp.AAC.2
MAKQCAGLSCRTFAGELAGLNHRRGVHADGNTSIALFRAKAIQRERNPRVFCHEPRRPARVCTKRVAPSAAMRARFAVDVKFGCKEEALRHLSSWASEVGQSAKVSESDVRLMVGSIGSGQGSRAELEFDLAEGLVESFLHTIGGSQHRSWERRLAPYTSEKFDGPSWQLYQLDPLRSKPAVPDKAAKHNVRGEDVGTRNTSKSIMQEHEENERIIKNKSAKQTPSASALTMLTDPLEIEKLLARDADLDKQLQLQQAQGRKRNNVQGYVNLRLSSEMPPVP